MCHVICKLEFWNLNGVNSNILRNKLKTADSLSIINLLLPLCYPLLPLVTLITPCYLLLPLLPLVTLVTPCYPLLPLLPLVTPCYPCYRLLPSSYPCYPLLFLVPFFTLVTPFPGGYSLRLAPVKYPKTEH